jgi:hypothetical protein
MFFAKMKHTFFLFLFFSLITQVMPAAAQEGDEEGSSGPISLSASAGFDSFYKSEFWVPVHINVSNSGPAVTGQLEIVVGGSTSNNVLYTSPVDLPTQSNKRLTIYVYLSNLTNVITVTLVDDRERELAEVETNTLDRLAVDDLLYGVVSVEANELAFLEDVTGSRRDVAVAFLNIDDLPKKKTLLWQAKKILLNYRKLLQDFPIR